ncbi:hypothetical protein BpHYR1_034652 [Brachionus plicatilis]|uniref:Uncharacterized protein n=1 Tax=Brachionus plicatilis TaxID=10195 RepID=A0A3M7SXX8_BRAPC|nr:hypothetical protein BpHYR1_034652 [Brachionus plicatilis]
MAYSSFEKNLNREFLFYHRDNDTKEKNNPDIAKQMNEQLIDLSSKLTQVPVVLVDKRTKKKKTVNKKVSSDDQNVKNSPSYLLKLMRSIAEKSKKKETENAISSGNTNSEDSLYNSQRYSKNLRINSDILNARRDYSAFRIPIKRLSSNKVFKSENLYKSDEFLLRQDYSDLYLKTICDSSSTPYVDREVFDNYLKSNENFELNNVGPNNVQDLNCDGYIEFFFNISKNTILLSILLLIVWPGVIVFKLFWLITNYSSCLFPNLEDFEEFFDRWHRNFLQLDDKILDQITFLN